MRILSEKTIYKMNVPKFEEIEKIYIGKPDRCMCGCSGDYLYTNPENYLCLSLTRKEYTRICNIFVKLGADGIDVIDDYIFTVIKGKKQYTIYLYEENGAK